MIKRIKRKERDHALITEVATNDLQNCSNPTHNQSCETDEEDLFVFIVL